MAVLAFPLPEQGCAITQTRLWDLKRRIAEWNAEGRRIHELSIEIMADLAAGKSIDPGRLTIRCQRSGCGPEETMKLIIE